MRQDLLRGRGASVDSVGTEVAFLAVSHRGSRSRRGAPMCRGASARSPPVFHQAAGAIVLSPADARVGQNGITDLPRPKRTLRHFATSRGAISAHRAAAAARPAIRPAMPLVMAGPGARAGQRFDYAEQTTPGRSTSFRLYALSWASSRPRMPTVGSLPKR